ncbi:L2 [Enhydra lutris papillomavirus 1]|uniref:Minor capsid protein L2 n=1 Tax=Enhydra lutris papillomavirus 1 TaxID=1472717 RepID=W8R5Z3_9PAPI|nr:L2 [Enhydra lutris papillomavirus 1]AHL83547.1 L2 [Enhydra lutris papillomavirus 1]
MLRSRKRRAAPTDIYPACKISNTCPRDIVDKFEHNTLADKILKYGSAGVFFGSLGIGTGKGFGGSTGYVPLGEGAGVRLGTQVTTVRPNLPISSVHPTDVIPVDAVDPLGPAIIPLREFPPFPTATEEPPNILPERFPIAVEESSAVVTSTTDTPFVSPKVTTDGGTAVLEVVPETKTPRLLSRTQYSNPTFEVSLTSSAGSGESSASDHIFIHGQSGGQRVGQQIVMAQVHRPASTPSTSFASTEVEETSFITSTPRADAPPARPARLYNRRVQQVPIRDPAFITHPRTLVTFENPTFTPLDVDLLFAQDVADIAQAAPHDEFRDIVALSKVLFSKNPDGGVRVSRFGQKAIMKTRSGLKIGPQSHYYYDISDVQQENIELVPLNNSVVGEQSGETVLSSGPGDFEIVSLTDSATPLFTDEELLDHIESVGNDLQLIIGERTTQRPVSVSEVGFGKPPSKIFPGLDHVQVIHAGGDDSITLIPINPQDYPGILIEVLDSSGDFYLHPSLLKRKRRKRPSF